MEKLIDKSTTEIMADFGKNDKDSGSSAVQIAILTTRMASLTEHMKANPKDFHSRFGLIRMVNKRKKLLAYLKRTKQDSYTKLIERLGLRK